MKKFLLATAIFALAVACAWWIYWAITQGWTIVFSE